jgi:hypothetical protein
MDTVKRMAVQLYAPASARRHSLPRRLERKFYLPPARVDLACGLLRHTCLMDREYASEQINSLYFDTPDLDQHERSCSGDFRKDKIRIRWYGREQDLDGMRTIFLELKSREGFASTKQRLEMQVSAEDLALHHLGHGIVPRSLLYDTLASFGHFPGQPIIPVVKISYWRHRFVDFMSGQRVSLDSHIRSTMVMIGAGWCNGEKELELPGAVIEIKGQVVELPATLVRMKMLDMDWGRFSKYSACIDSHMDAVGTVGRLSPSGRLVQA